MTPRSRFLALALTLLAGGQLSIGAPAAASTRPDAATPRAATDAAPSWSDPSLAEPTVRLAEDSGCGIAVTSTGGLLSSCPDVTDLEDLEARLPHTLDALRDASRTSPLTVRSDPPGATVTLNGATLGITPYQGTIRPGSYLVRIEKEGYAPFSHVITVVADQPTTVEKTLDLVGGRGTSQPVPGSTLLGLLGPDVVEDGELYVQQLVRDRDGRYFIAFTNNVERHFPKPDIDKVWPDIGDNYIGTYGSDLYYPRTQAVAVSADDGRSWSLVAKWVDHDTWTLSASKPFDDVDWNKGTPNPPNHTEVKQHWVRIAYEAHTTERYRVEAIIPRLDGGVTIHVWRSTRDQREVQGMYDNLPASWCRADDPDFGKKNTYCTSTAPKDVYRYIDRDYLTWKDPDDLDKFHEQRFGMSKDDLAEWDDSTSALSAYEADGSSKPVVKPGIPDFDNRDHILSLSYLGRYEDPDTKVPLDYFLTYQKADLVRPCSFPATCDYVFQPAIGTVATSSDGGRTLTVLEQFSDADAKVCNDDVLLCEVDGVLGPDGVVYIRDQDGAVAIVEPGGAGKATIRRLGNGFPTATRSRQDVTFRVDAAGNGHEVFTFPNQAGSKGVDVYEQYFAAKAVAYSGVELVTTGECPVCDAAAAYLTAAGVPFTPSPRPGLYPDAAYPVLRVTRDGTPETIQHASPSAISRALGVSYPAIVVNEATRFTDAYLQDGEIRVVVRGTDGITALAYADGAWSPTRLTEWPGDGFFNRMWSGSPYGEPDAGPDDAAALPYAYMVSTSGKELNGWWQDDNQLWTSKQPDTTESFTAVSHVSQLIPASAFEVFLPEGASTSAVEGELAPYVKSQATVRNGSKRALRVVVDLRLQGETAVMSQIVPRVIGGSVTITVPHAGGATEQRVVALLLLVESTPLRAADPAVPGKAIDISAEAVLFRDGGTQATATGEATRGRWIVTNNLPIDNSIPCGDGRPLLLQPNSVTTFTTDEVGQKGLGSCLDAIESAPTVITGCESWADAQLVLAADTIDSLRSSLALTRVAGMTNYELAFGSGEATIHRIVAVDRAVLAEATGRCASEVDEDTAAVVEITGRILGDSGERFTPSIKVIQTGNAATVIAATDDPGVLAWERHYLDAEAGFLEAALSVSEAEQPLWDTVTLQWAARRDEVEHQLLATRALLHCNQLGESIASVQRLIDRQWWVAGADLRVRSCLLDFILAPGSFWAGDPDNLPATDASLGTSLHAALVANPTLAFLVASTAGGQDYQAYLLKWADSLADPKGEIATAYSLDVVNRLLTLAASEMTGPRGRIQQLVLLADPLERAALREVIACAGAAGTPNPFPRLFEATSSPTAPTDLPCLSGASGGDPFKLLAIGLRSGPYEALSRAAGTDLDLLHRYLELAASVLDEVELAEKVYPSGTLRDALETPTKLSPVARFVILRNIGAALRASVGNELTVAQVRSVAGGVVDCGVGLVKGIASAQGVIAIGAGVAAGGLAVFLGVPAIGAAVGAYFFVDGVRTTYDSAVDVSKRFEALDLRAKSAGICGVAAGVLMTIDGGRGVRREFGRLRSPRELAETPPTVIAEDELPTEGNAGAATFEEQADALAPAAATIAEPPALPPTPTFDTELDAAIGGLDAGEQPLARDIADRLGYVNMSDAEKKVARKLLALPTGARARAVDDAITLDLGSQADKAAWKSVGRAIAAAPNQKPKSIVIDLQAAHPTAPTSAAQLAGADAPLVLAAAAGTTAEVVGAALGSPRASRVLKDLGKVDVPGTPLLVPEEAGWLTAWRESARPGDAAALVANLAGKAFASTLKTAVYTAQQLLKGKGDISSVTVTYLARGAQRTVFKLVGAGADRDVPLVAKLGPQSSEAVAFQREHGELGLSARVLADPIVDIDGHGNTLTTEEFLPGDTVESVFFEKSGIPKATIDAGTVKSLAHYMYDQFRLTKERYGTAKIGIDDHLGNLQRLDDGLVKSLEADLTFARDVTEEQFYAIELLRRTGGSEYGAWLLPGDAMVPYIGDFLALWAEEKGAAGARQLLERIRDNLADASFREGVFKIQDRSFAEFYLEDGTPFHVPPDFETLDFLKRVSGNLTTEINEALGKFTTLAPAGPPRSMTATTRTGWGELAAAA
jgi:hypothetical protein